MSHLVLLPFSLLLDRILGEPSYYHPLVGFGKFANWIEVKFNKEKLSSSFSFIVGVTAWLFAVIPLTLFVYLLDDFLNDYWLGSYWLGIFCGWLAIGWQSLRQHGLAVEQALNENNLEQAREKTAYLVSRDTRELDETALSRATIESILENGSDAVIAPLFWLLIFGAPGVILYRLSNTLDAMWGYHTPQFEYFGKFTARVDDVLNYIPARITALLYALCGNSKQAWNAWKTQGVNWYSPNAGVVMASGAGALNIQLGGSAIYNGLQKIRPELGFEKSPMSHDIKRAIQLLDYAVYTVAIITAVLSFIYSVLM